jgi:hypothetical protein
MKRWDWGTWHVFPTQHTCFACRQRVYHFYVRGKWWNMTNLRKSELGTVVLNRKSCSVQVISQLYSVTSYFFLFLEWLFVSFQRLPIHLHWVYHAKRNPATITYYGTKMISEAVQPRFNRLSRSPTWHSRNAYPENEEPSKAGHRLVIKFLDTWSFCLWEVL